MIRRAVFTSITLLCSSTSTAGGVMSLEEAEAREGRLEAPHEFRSADGRIRARVPAKVDEVRDTGEGLVVSFDIGSDARLACRITAGDPDLGDAMRRSFEVAIQKVQGLRGHVQMLAPEAPDAGAMGAIPYLSMRWQYGTSDGSEFLAVHGFKQLAFAKLGHLVSCWHLDTGYVKTFDTVTRALAESLQAPFAEPAPYFVEIKTTTAVGSRVGVFMSTLQREASGGIRARQVTALMIPGSGEMHSHFADHLVLLRADGSLLSAGHSILRDGAPALKVELLQRDGLWTVDGQREGSPMRATLAAGSKPATWVEQAQD